MADRLPGSEFDPFPERNKTKYQEFRSYAEEHKDDGWDPPVSSAGAAPDPRTYSDDPPPSHGRA